MEIGPATEIWWKSYCFRVDHDAPNFGRATRRVYRCVGFEGRASFSYDPDIAGGDKTRPWGSTAGRCISGMRAAEVTVKKLEAEIAAARDLVNMADAHARN